MKKQFEYRNCREDRNTVGKAIMEDFLSLTGETGQKLLELVDSNSDAHAYIRGSFVLQHINPSIEYDDIDVFVNERLFHAIDITKVLGEVHSTKGDNVHYYKIGDVELNIINANEYDEMDFDIIRLQVDVENPRWASLRSMNYDDQTDSYGSVSYGYGTYTGTHVTDLMNQVLNMEVGSANPSNVNLLRIAKYRSKGFNISNDIENLTIMLLMQSAFGTLDRKQIKRKWDDIVANDEERELYNNRGSYGTIMAYKGGFADYDLDLYTNVPDELIDAAYAMLIKWLGFELTRKLWEGTEFNRVENRGSCVICPGCGEDVTEDQYLYEREDGKYCHECLEDLV